MLAKLGCTYVVVGHSERRQYHHEDDALVNAKVQGRARPTSSRRSSASARGWRSARPATTWRTARASSTPALDGLTAEQVEKIVIAYEPVWAIGTGKTATPEDAQEVCGAIRARLAELYGGEHGRRRSASCTAAR